MPRKKQSQPASNKVTIREYTEDQQKQVYSLILSIFELELPDVPAAGYLDDIYAIHDVYGGERNRFWTATIGKRVVGVIAIKEDSEDEAIMRRFFVSPVHRTQGVAKKLFNEVVGFAKKVGYKKLLFIGNSQMHRARKTLLKYGFKELQEINLGEVVIFKSAYEL